MRSYVAVSTEFSTYCKASVIDFHQRLAYWKQNILVLEISNQRTNGPVNAHLRSAILTKYLFKKGSRKISLVRLPKKSSQSQVPGT